MEREMNFWDLCVAIGHGIGRLCAAGWRVLSRMIRLTYKYWYIVVTLVVLAIGMAIYHTRPKNIHYHVQATALINGASLQQFEQAFAPLQTGLLLPEGSTIWPYMFHKQAQRFEIFRIVDSRADEVPDYIDFKRKSSSKDSVEMQMQDRVCIRFVSPTYAVPMIPDIEKAVLDMLNSNEALQQSFEVYRKNLEEEVAFNHRQAVKLDSLTSTYYYAAGTNVIQNDKNSTGVNFYGDRKIRLFLKEIYKQQRHTQLGDYKLQLATAPVVLENHFTLDPKPLMTRAQCILLFFLLGWCGGCLIAELIDKRSVIASWLKQ